MDVRHIARTIDRGEEKSQPPARDSASARNGVWQGGLVPPDNRGLVGDLQRQLREINAALAELGAGDA